MGSSSDYELQSKDRGREGKNHFFFLLVVIVTPSPRQCHTTSLEINVAKTWRDWKDLQHMTRYESAIIVNTQTHTHTRTGRNRMQCFPKFHTFAAIPIQETTWCITLAKPFCLAYL